MPDPAAGDFEDPAERGVARVGGVLAVGHEAAVLELDDVVNLGLGELLHL